MVGTATAKVIMRLHDEIEWDPKKAAANHKKHGVTFEAAEGVLNDDEGDVYHLDAPDDDHSIGEWRTITTGSLPLDRRVILRICWTDRSTAQRQITRIISVRHVTKKERTNYVEEIGDR
jgi:uncharacterized DUF497 family protein